MEIKDDDLRWFQPRDFRTGKDILVFGKKIFLYDCDNFTRHYYKTHLGVEDMESIVVAEKPKLKPSKISALADDKRRRFVVSFFPSDDSVTIDEESIPNSGFPGGLFFKRNKILKKRKESSVRRVYYRADDFYIGAQIRASGKILELSEADPYVHNFMDDHPELYSEEHVKTHKEGTAALQNNPEYATVKEDEVIEKQGEHVKNNYGTSPCPLPKALNLGGDLQNKERVQEVHDVIGTRLHPIVIDGSNVAMTHGKLTNTFSVKGIELCIEEFRNRGHDHIIVFVPKYRHSKTLSPITSDHSRLKDLEKEGYVVFTPSRPLHEKLILPYDDRFIIEYAVRTKGIIVSNDYFRDLVGENDAFKEAIEQRLLIFMFVGDEFMIPEDPYGIDGPTLTQFLRF